jgi:primosomal protein N'
MQLEQCGNCEKTFMGHEVHKKMEVHYTEDESQYDFFCKECVSECSHELWVNEDK